MVFQEKLFKKSRWDYRLPFINPGSVQAFVKVLGWSVQSNGDLKFNSGSMDLSNRLYHHMRCYTNLVLAPGREAKNVEQTLLRTYFERWRNADQPVYDWKMLLVEQTFS